MGGFAVGRMASTVLYPNCKDYDIAASQVIMAGDLVVLTGVSGSPRVRKVTAADITNNFTESSVVKGLLGMAMHDANTDANGVSLTPITPSYVSGAARAIYPVPNYAASTDADPVTGANRLIVAVFDGYTEFFARAAGAANAPVTVSPALIGTLAGIQIVNVTDFSLNTAATGAALVARISGEDEQDKYYNTPSSVCKVLTQVLPAYEQYRNGTLYAS